MSSHCGISINLSSNIEGISIPYWVIFFEGTPDGGTPFPMSVSHTIPMLQGGTSIQVVMFTSYFHRIHATNGIFTYYLLIYHENNPKLPRYTIKINELYHTWNPNDLYFRRDPTPPKQGQNSNQNKGHQRVPGKYTVHPPWILSHTIHGTGIFTYIWLIFMVNVGKYTSPMDCLGMESFLATKSSRYCAILRTVLVCLTTPYGWSFQYRRGVHTTWGAVGRQMERKSGDNCMLIYEVLEWNASRFLKGLF